MPPLSTGLSSADAQDDFLRARRGMALARLRRRLRRDAGDVDQILPFDEVIAALGRVQERDGGLKVIDVDAIVGTVDRPRGFDRQFRPTTADVRVRWERIAAAVRRGEAMPPIDVYRVGEVYFVRDGHHRVSVARALGLEKIDARITEVVTRVAAGRDLRIADLPLKSHERVFLERVPLPPEALARVQTSDPWDLAKLAEGVEAWAFRRSLEDATALDRAAAARAWYEDEYLPVVTLLRDAGMLGEGSEADAYLRIGSLRYRLLRTHEWSEDVLERLRRERRG